MILHPVVEAIRNELIVRAATVNDACSLACNDLYLAHQRIWALEARLEAAERQASHGYLRRSPCHPARQPRPEAPAVDDDWIATGREP